jgi:hypothetical protein
MPLPEAILFRTCLGLNDTRSIATQQMTVNPRDPKAGQTELLDSLNLTTAPDGRLEKIPAYVPALTHSDPILAVSAGSRFLFQDGLNTNEWSGTAVTNAFPFTDGAMAHTTIDCRVSGTNVVYKNVNSAPGMLTATVGANPNPPTSRTFAGQPAFSQAFTYNSKLYGINQGDPRFLQYSEDYHYDLWNLGDGFIGHHDPVLQAGAIPHLMLALHSTGVSMYSGMSPADFTKTFAPLPVLPGSLYSGFISKLYGYGHVFLCAEGVYIIKSDGVVTNLTPNTTNFLSTWNTTYYCAIVQGSKYLAFGDKVCVEYDFNTQAVLKRSTDSVVSAANWKGNTYFARGAQVATLGDGPDTGGIAASMTLPFSDFGAPGTKAIDSFYFTGTIAGDVTFTVTDQTQREWSVDVSSLDTVTGYRIKCPHQRLGNHISVRIDVGSGAFRIEELKARFIATDRSR